MIRQLTFKEYDQTVFSPTHQEIMLNCRLERTMGICWELFGVRGPLAVITMEMVVRDLCFLQILSKHRDIRYFGSRSVFLIPNCMEKIWPSLILRLLPSMECK